MKKILIFLSFLLMSIWAFGALSSPYTCTFTSGMSMSGSNCTTGDVTWTISTTTGKGSPTITFGNQNGQSCIKFGSGKSNYYSKMTLTTSAFSSYNVSSVVLYISSNNGGSKTIKVTQGTTTIGTGPQSFSSTSWVTYCTRNTTSGAGGDLNIEISSDATATFVHSIKITYSGGETTYSVTYNLNGGTGTVPTESAKAKDVTFTLHNGTSNITPPSCKTFSKWKDQDNNEFNGGATYTMPAKNVTLTAQWVDVPLYTVSFNNAIGENPSSIKQPNCTIGVALPTPTFSSACEDDGWEFAGWSESNSDYSSLKTGTYTPENDTTLYAVYKKSEGGGNEWMKLTSNSLSNGMNIVIVADTAGKALFQETAWTTYVKYWNFNINNIDDNVKNYVTLSASEETGEWYIGDNTNGWLYNSSSNDLKFDEVSKSSWLITYNNNKFSINSNRCLSCRSDLSGDKQYKFRMGGSACNAGEHEFDIYAKIGTIVYSFNPSCCEKQVTITKVTDGNGDFDLDKTTLCGDAPGGTVNISNIVPNDGYEFDRILCVNEEGEETGTIDDINKQITEITTNCYVIVIFKELPLEPDIDIVEWNPDYVKIDIENFEGAITAIVENKNTQEAYTENVATELFFSKYFEAESTIKLLGIYNGKKDSVDLSEYTIKAAAGDRKTTWDKTYSLSNIGWIHSGEEIILYSYDNGASEIVTCINNYSENGFENYIRVQDGGIVDGVLNFNGDDAIGLFKNTTLIDIIGAGNASAPNVDGLKGKSNGKDTTMYETHLIDNYCWITDSADNSNGYSNVIATDLCLLIRKSTVHSGDSAVKYNTTDFVTLANEWVGKTVVKKDSSTCKNFSYVGSFDYNEHYTQYVEIVNYRILQGDGTYQISIPDLDTLSCTFLKIIVSDGDERKEEEYKIPIFVTETVNSNNVLFLQEGEDCPECDVVIMNTGKLVVNSSLQNRDVTVYPGGVLVIPVGQTYHVNSLTLRRENDVVPYFSYKGTLILDDNFYIDLRTDAEDWRWMTLPFAHKVSDITYQNGKKPRFNSEMFIEYYDGQYRAEHKTGAWKFAKIDTTFNAGEGFLFGVDLPGNSKKTYRFTYIQDTIEHEKSDKTVKNLFAYGCNNSNLAPNHKGWNLIGNPFMDNDTTDITDAIGIGYLKKDSVNGQWTGGWTIKDGTSGKLRYAVIPVPKDQWTTEIAAAGGYESVLLDDYVLSPFKSFFVQLGGDENDMQTINFKSAKRTNRIVARNREYNENEELFLRVKLNNWKTGCFISNKFSDEYEPGDDLESRYPIYQTIGGYKLLYSAINDSIIEHGVQVISPQGTLCLDPKVDISKFEYIYVNHNDNWYNLKNGETVEIESGSFIIQAKRKNNDIPTGFDAIPTNGIYKFSDGKNVYINKNNTIFNVLGEKIK